MSPPASQSPPDYCFARLLRNGDQLYCAVLSHDPAWYEITSITTRRVDTTDQLYINLSCGHRVWHNLNEEVLTAIPPQEFARVGDAPWRVEPARPVGPRPPSRSPTVASDDVWAIVVAHARDRALTTTEIAQFVQSRRPDDPSVTVLRISHLLHFLHGRGRVLTWSGSEADALREHGISEPHQRHRYWKCQPLEAT